MRAKRWVGFQQIQNAANVVGGVLEPIGRAAVQWDVKMDAPFVLAGDGSVREGGSEIFENAAKSFAGARDDLMEIDVVREGGEFASGFDSRPRLQGRAEMQFADFDSVFAQRA